MYHAVIKAMSTLQSAQEICYLVQGYYISVDELPSESKSAPSCLSRACRQAHPQASSSHAATSLAASHSRLRNWQTVSFSCSHTVSIIIAMHSEYLAWILSKILNIYCHYDFLFLLLLSQVSRRCPASWYQPALILQPPFCLAPSCAQTSLNSLPHHGPSASFRWRLWRSGASHLS